jgi:hypothetical protein
MSLCLSVCASIMRALACDRVPQAYANAALVSYTTELYNSHMSWMLAAHNGSGDHRRHSNGTHTVVPPTVHANASYVMCPEAVGALSETLRRFSAASLTRHFSEHLDLVDLDRTQGNDSNNGTYSDSKHRDGQRQQQDRRVSKQHRGRNGRDNSSESSSSTSSSASEPSTSESGASHWLTPASEAHQLAVGDMPYMVLLAPSVSIDGLNFMSPHWDLAAGAGAKGRSQHSSQQQQQQQQQQHHHHQGKTGWVEIGCRVASVRHLPAIDVGV